MTSQEVPDKTRLAGGGGQGIWDRGTSFLWIQGKALLLT